MSKCDSLDEMYRFFGRHITKLILEEIDTLNNPISSKFIEFVDKSLLTRKLQGTLFYS